MDWTTILVAIIGALGGGGLVSLLRFRAENKLDDAEAEKARAEAEKVKAEAGVVSIDSLVKTVAALSAQIDELQMDRASDREMIQNMQREIDALRKENQEAARRERMLTERVDTLLFIMKQAGLPLPEWALVKDGVGAG